MKPIFSIPMRVYYEDTDAGGVVYYANYLKFMERARTEWLRDLGFEQDELSRTEGVIFAVRAAQVEYLKPARFNDALEVTVGLLRRLETIINLSDRRWLQGLRGEGLCCRRNNEISYEFSLLTRHDRALTNATHHRIGVPSFKCRRAGSIARGGAASLSFKQEVRRDAVTLCSGEIRIACLDADSFAPIAIPTRVAMAIKP